MENRPDTRVDPAEPPPVPATPPPPYRGSSSRDTDGRDVGTAPNLIIGLALVLVGVLFLLFRFLGIGDVESLWPFFVIAPGLAFFLGIALLGRRAAVLAFPGSVVTMVGLILLYQNSFDHFESWAYAWTLVSPTSIGLALIIFGALTHRPGARRVGGYLVAAGLILFAVGATFFELVLDISGRGDRDIASIVGAALLILAGLLVIGLGGFRTRRSPGRY